MNQCERVVRFMDEHGSITTMDAYEMGITRLASRIHELRGAGMTIRSEVCRAKNRYGEDVHFCRYSRE